MNSEIQKVEHKTAVSIIIPVYNVYEWIDQCMDSVVKQTFSNFEVILVDDGSTDGSGCKCREWVEKDSRIRLISKENEGPSKARNLGMREAKGTFLVFLDADDWIDSRYLEIMYKQITEADADMAECDVYRVNNETDVRTYRVCSGYMGRDYTLEEHMSYGYTAMWKCMFKKELFTKYNISFPDCHSEARAIYPLLLAVSRKVENVHEALYYYRIFRKGSLTACPRPANEDENAIGIKAMDLLLQGFEQCGIYTEYKETLRKIVTLKLADLLAVFFYRKEKKDFQKLAENYRTFICEKFPETRDYRYITLGGYNLNRIVGHMNVLHDPYCRFNFSSMISLMNPVREKISVQHRNRYREIMLKREIENQFWSILEEIRPEYLILDFIEERFDVLLYDSMAGRDAFIDNGLTEDCILDGGCLTASGAFDGAQWHVSMEHRRRISRNTEECHILWEQSCIHFIERLQKEFPSVSIILVQNYLSEKSGDVHAQESYENLEEIRQMNRILKRYYDFFESHCKVVKVVKAYQGNYYFTDRQYEYGVIPSHLNEIVNQEIAGMIERSMEA